MILNALSNPKHKQALYQQILYKSSEIVKIKKTTSLLLSFILKTLFKILSDTSPSMIKIAARKEFWSILFVLYFLVVMKTTHLTVEFRTFSTSFLR